MVAFGQRLAQSFQYRFDGHHRTEFQESAQHNHVEGFHVVHLGSCIHGVDTVDLDVLTRRRLADAVSVVDNGSTRLDLAFKLSHGGLVEDDSRVIGTQDGRRDAFVADDDRHVGSTATLLRTVCRHPGHFLSFHQAGISQDFTH